MSQLLNRMSTTPSHSRVAPLIDPGAGRRTSRTDAGRILDIVRNIRPEAGLEPVIDRAARQVFEMFSCQRIMVAAQETVRGPALLWSVRNARRDATLRLHRGTLGQSARASLLFSEPASWFASRRRGRSRRPSVAITYGAHADTATASVWSRQVSGAFAVVQPGHSCIAAAFELGRDWSCRLFIIDPQINRGRMSALGLAEDLVATLGPVLYNIYLTEQQRTRAADTERANLARALHDSVIQSLIAAEMELHAACRRASEGTAVTAGELRRIQELLHGEVLGLRDLMQRIKPVNIEPHELCDALAECLGKFKADTGISCSFSSDIGQLSLSAAMCQPVMRIVQEALSNVRKHSAACHVAVWIGERRGQWRLVIEDDGRGFDASLPPPSPLVIRECVRSLDGDLQVLRAAGGGMRLEIAFKACLSSTEGAGAAARLVTVNQRVRGAVHRVPARARGNGAIDNHPRASVRGADRCGRAAAGRDAPGERTWRLGSN
jgi:signal transduction histidine kinase